VTERKTMDYLVQCILSRCNGRSRFELVMMIVELEEELLTYRNREVFKINRELLNVQKNIEPEDNA
jgi:hypothetical protein